jgi:hypothetical protein
MNPSGSPFDALQVSSQIQKALPVLPDLAKAMAYASNGAKTRKMDKTLPINLSKSDLRNVMVHADARELAGKENPQMRELLPTTPKKAEKG